METKFTKGKWYFEEDKHGDFYINVKDGNSLEYLQSNESYYPWNSDNIHDWYLQAAAPDLYKALENFALFHRKKYGLDGAYDTELVMAEKALKKARGE